MVSRTRKIRFINEFGTFALMKAVAAAFERNGPDWLTDEQLDEIVRQQVKDWRATARMNRRNRELVRRAAS